MVRIYKYAIVPKYYRTDRHQSLTFKKKVEIERKNSESLNPQKAVPQYVIFYEQFGITTTFMGSYQSSTKSFRITKTILFYVLCYSTYNVLSSWCKDSIKVRCAKRYYLQLGNNFIVYYEHNMKLKFLWNHLHNISFLRNPNML